VVHSQEVYVIRLDSIDNAVTADYDLADVPNTQFRDDSARTREFRQQVCSTEDAVGERRPQLWRIPSDEKADHFEIIGCPGESTLLQPFRHALPDLFLADQLSTVCLEEASLDFIKQIKPIHGAFDPGIVGKLFNCFQYLLLRSHRKSPIPLRILALNTREG
jgi:hypothetical protein